MLRNILIFSLCFVTIQASGEFSVLSSPKSISFKGSDPLQSQYVNDVLNVAVANPVSDDATWNALTVNDPFHLENGVIAVLVEGTNHIAVNSNAKTFELIGDSSDRSLSKWNTELEEHNVPFCDIDFKHLDDGISNFRSCFGNVDVPSMTQTKFMDPNAHSGDKQFLQALSHINAVTANLATIENKVLIVRLSVENVAKSHGEKSKAIMEANKLLAAALAKLNTAAQKSSNGDSLVVLIASVSSNTRSKRAAETKAILNPYNLAVYYSQDYPVIFNIILWFMVTFALALLAISYAIGSMDPGRDSIIYRMTSTRMKKDN